MQYPLFNSIVNKIKSSLGKKNINVSKFRTWDEPRINATGLEMHIDLSGSAKHLKGISINFDWDRFRETTLARSLDGLQKHPFLKSPHLLDNNIEPMIDIEVVWEFDVDLCQPAESKNNTNYRVEAASKWMDEARLRVNELLLSDDIITRWHIEIEGDDKGKYLTAINLISYFQYSLATPKTLNETLQLVDRRLHHLLYKANRVVRIADPLVKLPAA